MIEDRVWAQKDVAQRLGVAEGAIVGLMEEALATLSLDFTANMLTDPSIEVELRS